MFLRTSASNHLYSATRIRAKIQGHFTSQYIDKHKFTQTHTQTTEIFRCVGVNNINIYTNMQKVNEINNCKCVSVEKQSNT